MRRSRRWYSRSRSGGSRKRAGYIDGQIYIRNYRLVGQAVGDQHNLDMLIFHVRDVVHAPAQPTWHDIGPILSQFGNLYPVMSRRLINLSDPADVRANAQVMKLVLTLPLEDPNHMPVTRDLSLGKRNLIVTWLDNPIMEPTELESA